MLIPKDLSTHIYNISVFSADWKLGFLAMREDLRHTHSMCTFGQFRLLNKCVYSEKMQFRNNLNDRRHCKGCAYLIPEYFFGTYL